MVTSSHNRSNFILLTTWNVIVHFQESSKFQISKFVVLYKGISWSAKAEKQSSLHYYYDEQSRQSDTSCLSPSLVNIWSEGRGLAGEWSHHDRASSHSSPEQRGRSFIHLFWVAPQNYWIRAQRIIPSPPCILIKKPRIMNKMIEDFSSRQQQVQCSECRHLFINFFVFLHFPKLRDLPWGNFY